MLAVRAFIYRVLLSQRLWRRHSVITCAQLETFTRQCVREHEKRAQQDLQEAIEASTNNQDAADEVHCTDPDGGHARLVLQAILPCGATHISLPESIVRDSVRVVLLRRRKERAQVRAKVLSGTAQAHMQERGKRTFHGTELPDCTYACRCD